MDCVWELDIVSHQLGRFVAGSSKMFITPWFWAWASKTSSLNGNEDKGGLLEVSSLFLERRVHGFVFFLQVFKAVH